MASMTEIFATSNGAGTRMNNLTTNLRARWEAHKVYRTTYSELAGLSDRELADLGMHRGNIASIAYEAAYGK